MAERTASEELMRCLTALRLEVDGSIVDHISQYARMVIAERDSGWEVAEARQAEVEWLRKQRDAFRDAVERCLVLFSELEFRPDEAESEELNRQMVAALEGYVGPVAEVRAKHLPPSDNDPSGEAP